MTVVTSMISLMNAVFMQSLTLLAILVVIGVANAAESDGDESAQLQVQQPYGGTSVSGVSVTCYQTMQDCKDLCRFSCYEVDHCNDSPMPMVACAPDLSLILVLTFICILSVAFCCCLACCCLPICCCYKWCRGCLKKSRAGQGAVSLRYNDIKTNSSLLAH